MKTHTYKYNGCLDSRISEKDDAATTQVAGIARKKSFTGLSYLPNGRTEPKTCKQFHLHDLTMTPTQMKKTVRDDTKTYTTQAFRKPPNGLDSLIQDRRNWLEDN